VPTKSWAKADLQGSSQTEAAPRFNNGGDATPGPPGSRRGDGFSNQHPKPVCHKKTVKAIFDSPFLNHKPISLGNN
jgi:hypothetical protein